MAVRSSVSGACAALSCLATGLGAWAALTPMSGTGAPLARILDGFAPALFLAGLVLAGLSAVLGARAVGLVLALAAAGGGGALHQAYHGLSLPIRDDRDGRDDRAAEISVLFFNAQHSNSASGAAIVDAALVAAPDIVVFAEASAVLPGRDALREAYDFVSPCSARRCEILVATNLPVVRFWQIGLNPVWPDRYAVLEVARPDGGTFFLAASHLLKPWLSGVSESEISRLTAQYRWLTGPVVAVGDFNMPPWSQPMRRMLAETGLRATRGQPASWPVGAGRLGLPIDQILVRDGPQVVAVRRFGEGLGSNHTGFVAGLAFE